MGKKAASRGAVDSGKAAATPADQSGRPKAVPASFDSELDDLFSSAASTSAKSKQGDNGTSKSVLQKRQREQSEEASEGSGDEEEEHVVGEESVGEEDSSIAAQSDSDDVALEREEALAAGRYTLVDGEGSSDGESSDAETSNLVHETLLKDGSPSTKSKTAHMDVPQAEKDARSIFVGNLPLTIATSRSGIKALKRLLIERSPYPSLTQIESIRFRSIPFATPTDDFAARNPGEAETGARKRQRTLAYKDRQHEASGEPKKVFLTGSQKRKVAFIKQDVNERADGLNAYVTLAPLPDKALARLKETHEEAKVDRLSSSILAALLAVSADGSRFEGRHLRTDLVVALEPAEIIEAGLDKVKTADGNMVGASVASGGGADFEARKKTIFVGNMDFETKEEELREFFHVLLQTERGAPPEVKTLDFAECSRLPLPEAVFANVVSAAHSEQSWVRGVRIVRDAATQMGKGFGYVRFIDRECVEEVMAISESEQAFLAASKSGQALPSVNGQFRRKLKLKGRPLRVSRCKAPKGNVTSSRHDASSTPIKKQGNSRQSPKHAIGTPVPNSRSRSSGAPTPGGTSPFMQRRAKVNGSSDSPSRPRSSKISSNGAVANPKAKSDDPLKLAKIAHKKADPERQAKRLAKKDARRSMQQSKSNEKVLLKPKSKGKGAGHKAGKGVPLKHRSFVKTLLHTAALAVAFIMTLAMPAEANNEISVFGPVLCHADEVGHLNDIAARRVSKSWPLLTPSSKTRLFSLSPAGTGVGVWMTLSIESAEILERQNMILQWISATPQNMSTSAFPLLTRDDTVTMSPRDQWITSLRHRTQWLFSRRYTFRINWAPNFPLIVTASIHTAESMLAHGATSYRAGEHELTPGDEARIARLAGGVDIDDDTPRWPCPRLYVHIEAQDAGVPIPAPDLGQEASAASSLSRVWSAIVSAGEAYVGPLTRQSSVAPGALLDEHRIPVPVHIVWEHVYFGFVPATALRMLSLLVSVSLFVYLFVLPPIQRAVTELAKDAGDREASHVKQD